jgi:type IV pilus assembly protein PilV
MHMKKSQQGVMLLEAMIGILIFSMGILAIIGMQARSIASVSDAMYRSQASFLADEIIGQMWVDRGVSLANLANYAYPPGGAPALATWVAKLQTELPQGAATIAANTATGFVTVTVTWQPPNVATPHSLTAVAQITDPN